jgi:hypothetical protein
MVYEMNKFFTIEMNLYSKVLLSVGFWPMEIVSINLEQSRKAQS